MLKDTGLLVQTIIAAAYPSVNGRMQDIAARKMNNAIRPSVSKNGCANMTINSI